MKITYRQVSKTLATMRANRKLVMRAASIAELLALVASKKVQLPIAKARRLC